MTRQAWTRSLGFAAACAAVIGAAWLIGVLVFSDAVVRRALGMAAAVAFLVQQVAFAIARAWGGARKQNVMAGWGIGIALRFSALLLFGLVAVPSLGLPLSASLLGLAIFLFVTTLIEPLFLKP
jgi:hypothetical protein